MRKILIAAATVIGFMSIADVASANCISLVVLPRPHCNAWLGSPRVAPGFAGNRIAHAMPPMIRALPGPISRQIVGRPIQTGYRVQETVTVARMCHDWILQDGVKVYTKHYAC